MRAAAATVRPLKVVAVMHSHALGGAERHVIALLEALRERGHDARYAGPRSGWLGEQIAQRGFAILDLGMRGMYDPWSALRLARYLRRERIDIVHGHSMRGTRYAAWAGRLAGVPAVGTAHSTTRGRWLKGAGAILPVSAAVRTSLLEQGYGEKVLEAVYPGVADHGVPSAQQRAAQRAALGLGDTEYGMVMLGRLVRDKGHDLAIAALARLRELPIKLFIYGDGDPAWTAALRAQVEREGLQGRVCFLGQQVDASRTLGAFDLFLQPSRREALSLALLEAGAQELPIVASEIGGIPEIVRDGQTGLLVPGDDAVRLAQRIGELLADAALARRLGVAARQQFIASFTTTAMIRRIETIYTQHCGQT